MMNKHYKFIAVVFACFFMLNVSSQNEKLHWLKSYGNYTNQTGNICVDKDFNYYVLLEFLDSMDADLGPNKEMLYSDYNDGIMIAKYNKTGQLIWGKAIQGDFPSAGTSINVDGNSNVYLSGRFQDSGDFDPGNAEYKLYSQGMNDFFIAKLNSSGDFVWAHGFGSTDNDFIASAVVDGKGNVYMTGNYRGNLDFDPSAGSIIKTPTGLLDLFLLKLTTDGDYQWVITYGGTEQPTGFFVSLDPYENVVLSGKYHASSNFNPLGTAVTKSTQGNHDFFVARYNPNGLLMNVFTGGGPDVDYAMATHYTKENGVFVFGNFQGTAVFDPNNINLNMTAKSSMDRFVAKYDTNGNCIWRYQMPLTGNQFLYLKSIISDKIGNAYVICEFRDSVDVDPGSNTKMMYSSGVGDIYIQKISPFGNLIWAKQIGSAGNDRSYSMEMDEQQQLYILGTFSDSCIFNIDNTPALLRRNSAIGNSAFVLKMGDQKNINVQDLSIEEWVLFPNPSHDALYITGLKLPSNITVVNALGRVVYQGFEASNEHVLSINSWGAGTYTLSIQNAEGTLSKKIVVIQ
jgi:hypothetical protein